MAEEVVASTSSRGVGTVLLNRPKALNSLNQNMVTRLLEIYRRWDSPGGPHCIVIKGAGDKAFCAGGDVKAVVLQCMAGRSESTLEFFRGEYELDYRISRIRQPQVALLDGIVMGGGAGVSIHGAFRVATQNTVFAMPECAIGLHPDIGASHFLHKLPGQLGIYLALTGARIKGIALKECGLATHYIQASELPRVEAALERLGSAAADLGQVHQALCGVESSCPAPSPSGLLSRLPLINYCFSGSSIQEIMAILRDQLHEPEHSAFCQEALDAMARASPLSLVLTLSLLRRSAHWPLSKCLLADFILGQHHTAGYGDFVEGVRALLIDRGTKPAWKFRELEDVPPQLVEGMFRPVDPRAAEAMRRTLGEEGPACRL